MFLPILQVRTLAKAWQEFPRLKELNDKRAAEEERKQMDASPQKV